MATIREMIQNEGWVVRNKTTIHASKQDLPYLYEATTFTYLTDNKDLNDILINKNVVDTRKTHAVIPNDLLELEEEVLREEIRAVIDNIIEPIVDGVLMIKAMEDNSIVYSDLDLITKVSKVSLMNK